jgi:hypothetical protein
MMLAFARMDMDGLSRFIASLAVRLLELAAGPELRVNYAIAQAAKRARWKRAGKAKVRSEAPRQINERSGEW